MAYNVSTCPVPSEPEKLDKQTAKRIFDAMDEVARLDDPRSQGKD
ncbi:MAG: type II toxin-antitoxin system RelE family toxin [Adlercreutzia equolifaciens]